MRLGPNVSRIAILIVGVALGAMAAWAFIPRPAPPPPEQPPAPPPPPIPEPTSPPPVGSSAELGAKLLRRVGRNLIGDDRATRWHDGPMELYAVPRPYGETLCRVDVYTVAPKIIRGVILDREEWDNDLKIETKYGLWKRPSAAGGNRDKACASFRDFRNLIVDDGNTDSVARATFVMDTILDQAKSGKFTFKISCIRASMATMKPKPCDPATVLRALSLQDIRSTKANSEVKNDHSSVRQDEVWMAIGKVADVLKLKKKGDVIVEIRIDDEQHFSKQSMDEADVRSVEILIAEGC